ncbi:PTS sugar transporter subunit IIA [Gilliamella sp. Pas-s95]|uniref:PTS sugar transporter subunit IIA n=1 Tax=Gilliamella sp. Pas-s95 TaxID=2687317 RepID=UPI001323F6C5|nr:PTS sugar transporter subunit IIA [Gilliamella sp. Pas-s95]MWN05153.1 PTS mannose transporter subunit IID [Gilliamella sp. Pas-s95]
MIAVLVSTHGSTANSMIETAEMICGKQTQCEAVPFLMGQSLDDFQQQIEQKLEKLTRESSNVLCFVDLKGGTPFNTLVNLVSKYPRLEVIAGVNIPMLLTTFTLRNDDGNKLNDLLSEVIDVSVKSIERYNIVSIMDNKSQDEDF